MQGERKGVNKYYPPDWTPDQGGINKYHGTHALRERARKLHMGILIIRFEMPYNIWCEGCKNHIGMGVRYNAEKKKIGMYYSTPVYQFRMKCHLCDNYFEIKTDPANLDYVIISGARRQERRWDPTTNEQVVPEDKAVSRKLASDAMFKLEHGAADTAKAKDSRPTIARLQAHQEVWKDDYAANRHLRDLMRDRKKTEKKLIAEDKELLNRGCLSINLLPKSDEDNRTAALLRLIPLQSPEEKRQQRQLALQSSSIFSHPRELASGSSSIKYIIKGKRNRELQQKGNDLKKAKNDDSFNSVQNPSDDESGESKNGLASGSCNEFFERNDVTSENTLRSLCQYDSSSSSLGSDEEVSGTNEGSCVVERSLPNPFSASPNL